VGEWWTLPQLSHQEGGRVAVVSDDVAEGVTDLSVSELFGEVQAKQHGTVQVRGSVVLLRSRGADDGVGLIHEDMMARIRTLWGYWWTVPQPSQPLSFDTNPYQQKYNTTKPYRAAALSIKNSRRV
jgi:hypothetical protein